MLSGALEPTNEWYAIAKISGIKLCESLRRQYGFDAISLMPTNLYGPGDNYHPENSHVLPALIRRFHEAKQSGLKTVTCWGTGSPLREFLHVDDLGKACVFALERWSALASDAPRDDQGKTVVISGTWVQVSISPSKTWLKWWPLLRATKFDPMGGQQARWHPKKQLDVSRMQSWVDRSNPLAEGLASTVAQVQGQGLHQQFSKSDRF